MRTDTPFSRWIDEYLAVRRQAGFSLKVEEQQLRRFAHFAEVLGHRGPITIKLAARWASSSASGLRLTAARRIEVVRPFLAYCRQFDPATEVPPRRLFGGAHRRLAPHIFTDDEILDLLADCDHLYPPGGLRGASCATIFGLMAATGLRISEATGLGRPDVNLEQRLLHIRCAKYGKSRWVPIHRTTADALLSYVRMRDRDPLAANADSFFMFDYGRPASTRSVEYAFKVLRVTLQWHARGDHPRPRLHDLRHNSEAQIIPSATSIVVDMRRRCSTELGGAAHFLGIILLSPSGNLSGFSRRHHDDAHSPRWNNLSRSTVLRRAAGLSR